MTVYPLFVAINFDLVPGKPDFVQFSGIYYEDFNIDTGSSTSQYDVRMTCHKTAASITATNNYFEICINGSKYTSFNNEAFVFNGVDLVPLDCLLQGTTFMTILQ